MLANVAGAKVLTEVKTGSGSVFKVTEEEEEKVLHLRDRKLVELLKRVFGGGSEMGLQIAIRWVGVLDALI